MTSRERILAISYEHKLSHIGSCLSALPILEEIFSKKKPEDKVVLSSGHAGLALYVVLESLGEGNAERMLETQGIHPTRLPGENLIDVSTGSLGQGLPISVGLALSDRSRGVHCLVSDGEAMEGSIYESLKIARDLKLDNLHVIVNSNGWGAYSAIDQDQLERQLTAIGFPIDFRRTDSDIGTWAVGLASHYKPADEELLKI